MVTIVNKGSLLTIVNEELSLTIVYETTNFLKTVVFEKKLHASLFNVVLHEFKKLWGELKLLDIFFKTTQ